LINSEILLLASLFTLLEMFEVALGENMRDETIYYRRELIISCAKL
jgi:hypothetical protein